MYEAWKAYDVRDFDFLFDACFYSLTSIKGKYPYFEFPLEMEGQQKLSALIFLAITEKGFSPEQKVHNFPLQFPLLFTTGTITWFKAGDRTIGYPAGRIPSFNN